MPHGDRAVDNPFQFTENEHCFKNRWHYKVKSTITLSRDMEIITVGEIHDIMVSTVAMTSSFEPPHDIIIAGST